MSNTFWTAARRADLARYAAEGRAVGEIADLIGRHPTSITNMARVLGVELAQVMERNMPRVFGAMPAGVQYDDVDRRAVEREWPTGRPWNWRWLIGDGRAMP